MQKWPELAGLLEQVDKLAPRVVLEIGVGKGGTSWCWTKLSSVELILSIDLPDGPWGGGPTDASINYIRENSNCPYLYFAVDSHAPSTLEAIKAKLPKHLPQVDFLYIDGDHSYEGVKKDYEMYSPLVREGGLIALHDIADHPPETGCEVAKFYRELLEKGVAKAVEGDVFISEPQTWGGIGLVRV